MFFKFGTCCCGCNLCVTVRGCNNVALVGVTVTFKQGTTTLGTAVTNGAGQACFSVPASGTYSYTCSVPRYATGSGSVVGLTCPTGANATLNLVADSSHICCSVCDTPIPKTLFLTDANVTAMALTYNAGTNSWIGHYAFSTSPVVICGPPKTAGTNSMCVAYQFSCGATANTFQVSIVWNVDFVSGSYVFGNDPCTGGFSACPPAFCHSWTAGALASLTSTPCTPLAGSTSFPGTVGSYTDGNVCGGGGGGVVSATIPVPNVGTVAISE